MPKPSASPAPGPRAGAPPYCTRTVVGQQRGVLFSGQTQSIDALAPGPGPLLYGSSASPLGVRVSCVQVPSGLPCPGYSSGVVTVPCDAGPCYDAQAFFAVSNGSAFTGGSAWVYPDWPSATLIHRAPSFVVAAMSGDGFALLSSSDWPTAPLLSTRGPAGVFPDAAAGDPQSWWLQSFAIGDRACLTDANMTSLLSLHVFGPRPEDFVVALNASVPACPLPGGGTGGLSCFSVAAAHVAPFMSV